MNRALLATTDHLPEDRADDSEGEDHEHQTPDQQGEDAAHQWIPSWKAPHPTATDPKKNATPATHRFENTRVKNPSPTGRGPRDAVTGAPES